MLYKDACNSKSNQQNLGTIKCSNLCTEIVEYSAPDEVSLAVPLNTKKLFSFALTLKSSIVVVVLVMKHDLCDLNNRHVCSVFRP